MAAEARRSRPRAWSEPGRTTEEIRTGSWRSRRPEYVEATAPCGAACPAGEPIAHWIERARVGDWVGAWQLIREVNPFPAVTGRVCAHPCEAACNRAGLDGAVSIRALERFVGDWGLQHGVVRPPPTTRPARVAVVGAGPAGLACADRLARFGYAVTVFERRRHPGGLLRYGIPEYRLPRAVLERELELALGPSISVQTGCRLGGGLDWREVAGHDAVFLATGAGGAVGLGVPGEDASRVHDGIDFLRAFADRLTPVPGPRVAVVGGGSTAIDVARTARRLRAGSVVVLALETAAAMPALAEEVGQARAEAIDIVNEVGIVAFERRPGGTAVIVAPARLERAGDGTVRPVVAGGPRRAIEVDDVFLALGQVPELAGVPGAIERTGRIVAVDGDGHTSVDRVLAGGDVASRERTVAHAIGAGTRAARAIHARLGGERPRPFLRPRAWAVPCSGHVVGPDDVVFDRLVPASRAAGMTRSALTRVASFVEVLAGLGVPEARAEAQRCFTCGRCVACDVCLDVCPDLAIHRAGPGYAVDALHCKGCGLCATECPRGALRMVAEP